MEPPLKKQQAHQLVCGLICRMVGCGMWWGWGRGLKGEGWWVSQWEQQLHFLSPHCDALDPPNQQSATVLYHALNSISIILPHPTMVYHTFTHYHTITHPTSKDTRSSNCRWRQHQRGGVWCILERGLELKVSFYCKYDIYHIYGDGSDSGCEWIVMV